MKRMQPVSFVALLVALLGLLAACGGDTPTATPAPTTAPVVATAAPTNTLAPANTAAPAAATPAATTATGASGAGDATETPEAGGGAVATTADEQLIQESYTATRTLKSYHFTLSATGDVFTQPVQLEGDYVAPDKVYAKGTFNGGQGEMLKIGANAYKKDASGKWVADPENATSSGDPADITRDANVVESLGPFLEAGSNFKKTGGDESMDGVTVSHFTGDVDAGKMSGGATVPGMPSLGTTSLWIDPQTKFLHKLSMDVDLGAAIKMMGDMAQALAGTPTPGGPTATPMPPMKFKIEMTISKQNDPSLSVPTP
jgi:hypothetical protein